MDSIERGDRKSVRVFLITETSFEKGSVPHYCHTLASSAVVPAEKEAVVTILLTHAAF